MESNKMDLNGFNKSTDETELKSIDLHRSSKETLKLEPDKSEGNVQKADLYAIVVDSAIKTFNFITSLKLELITFLFIAAYICKSNTSVAMMLDRSCRVHLQYPDEICGNLNLEIYKTQKKQVETVANNYNLGHTLIGAIPSSILCCFVGPWSDKYSRRIPLIAGLIGGIIDDTLSLIWASMPDARIEWYFVPPIFNSASGGFIVAITILYSYASDITTPSNRTLKYALLEAALGFSFPLGVFAGGMIYKYSGGTAVFGTALGVHVVTLVLLFFLLKETRGIGNTDSWGTKIRVFFSTKNLMEGFRAAIKKRPHRGRLQLWMLFVTMSVGILVHIGSGNISFLFTHHHYNWQNDKYSTVSSVFSIMNIIIMMVAVPIFTKLLHLSDPMLGIIGSISAMAKLICFAFAATSGLYYLGNLMNLLSSVAALAGRARISKIIPNADLGKVFAFLSTAESLIPILSQAAISQLFNATVGMIPDPTFLIFTGLTATALGIYIWLYLLPKVNYEEMREEKDKPESVDEVDSVTESKISEITSATSTEKEKNFAQQIL